VFGSCGAGEFMPSLSGNKKAGIARFIKVKNWLMDQTSK
tara:strand:- start:681 stop:797 length:117 start_codon:yes stop_codon:yes gene_type:complete